jgi:hypothetical protein
LPAPDIVQESHRILEAAEEHGLTLRLLGGLAIRAHSPSATHRILKREYADIDLMGLRKQSREIKALFSELGYTPREIFNALQGDKRLVFNDIENQRRVDVFLDVFEMCHRFDFRDRLSLDKNTISLSDLLATKLQVVQMTEREYRDIIALIHDNQVGDTDAPETINGRYISHLCAENWGIYKTFTVSISNVMLALSQYQLDAQYREIVQERLQELLDMIEIAPKTTAWKIRARVGEKVRWYELPEGDKEVVNGQPTQTSH